MSDEVSVFYDRQSALIAYLVQNRELSLAQDVEQMLRKNLPLAAASFFEHVLTRVLTKFAIGKSNNCAELVSFFEQRAVKRQYHTLFDWEKTNVNKFLSCFGESFKAAVSKEISNDDGLCRAAKDFLEIGNMRNCIVHQNYAAYVTDKSSEEIFSLFKSARQFVSFVEAKLVGQEAEQ